MKYRQPLDVARISGFTIVELITVLLLLGILSSFAVSRLIGKDSFSPSMATQESIALMRFALDQAQARQDLTISFVLDQQAQDWRFRVISDRSGSATVLRSTFVEHKNVAIQATNGATSANLDASTSLIIDLDGLGNIASGAAGGTSLDPDLGVGLSITGNSTFSICLANSGYAYRGVCV